MSKALLPDDEQPVTDEWLEAMGGKRQWTDDYTFTSKPDVADKIVVLSVDPEVVTVMILDKDSKGQHFITNTGNRGNIRRLIEWVEQAGRKA